MVFPCVTEENFKNKVTENGRGPAGPIPTHIL